VLSQPAELLSLKAPTATVLSDSVVNGKRTLKVHVASPRGANMLLMRLPADVTILATTVNGRRVEISADDQRAQSPWLFRYNAPPPEGIELELELASATLFTCWLGDRSLGLPQLPGKMHAPRPPDMMPLYGSDVVLVGREYTF
jgi:hypothetical protein